MFLSFLRLLLSQSGQVPASTEEAGDSGTAPSSSDSFDEAFHAAEAATNSPSQPDAAPEGDTTAEGDGGADPKPAETFLDGDQTLNLDPKTFSPENAAIFKKMQATFTKRLQGIQEIKQQREQMDRFYNDADFAKETLVSWAAQNGYQLAPIGQAAAPANGKAPDAITNALKTHLPPELGWMADSLAPAMTQVMQQVLEPLTKHQQAQSQQVRASEYQRLAEELSNEAPGWEEHEDTMSELFDFFASPDMTHPKLGSKMKLLHNLATSQSAAIAEATKRVNAAARNRTSTPKGGARTQPNVQDEVMKAGKHDAFDVAARAALQQHRRTTQ